MPDNPIYPSHYKIRLRDGYQCDVIDIIEGLELNFNLGNALKYLARAGRKLDQPAMTDLQKCLYYLEREITNRIEDASKPPDDENFELLGEIRCGIGRAINDLSRGSTTKVLGDLESLFGRIAVAQGLTAPVD